MDGPEALAGAELRISTDRATLNAVLQQRLEPMQAMIEGKLVLEGQMALLARLFGYLDRFSGSFPVVVAAAWPA